LGATYGAFVNASGKPGQIRLRRGPSPGVETAIAEVAGLPPRLGYSPELDSPAREGRVAFLELKRTDFRRVEQILELSRRANHWTNFGPATAALERSLQYVMGVPRSRAVVMCSSGTTALFALVGLHALKQGRPLRIVTSAYGFFSSNIGPLAGSVTLIDCDERGLLDLELLARVPRDSYDAVMVTNVFGMSPELDAYRNFCRAGNKVLLVDNATAPIGYERNYDEAPDEIVSFHHTKPWGMGEGGCAVVAREDADAIRGFLNFGVGLPSSVAAYTTNGKISDFSSALILDRLERYPVWAPHYRAQYLRILRLAKEAGLREFRPMNEKQVHAHLPLLAPIPRGMMDLQNDAFPVRKYYKPLTEYGVPKASSLFEHMINLPTHSGMAAVPEDAIAETLRKIRDGIALGG
jgi:dTDP-4-amino-4,6-dideoxygalactose transaminase